MLTHPIPLPLAGAEGLDSRANCALGLPRSRTSTGSSLCAVSPSSPPAHSKRKRNEMLTHLIPLSLAGAEGLDSRANCALGLPRSRTSTGSSLCAVSPSSPPTHSKRKRNRMLTHPIPLPLAGAEGLEPTTHGFGDQYSTN